MIALQIQSIAELAIGRVLNSLPAGLLVALFAWAVLRLLPKQNSRTRFAVWFVALFAVVCIPLFGGLNNTALAPSIPKLDAIASAITVPAHWATFLFLAWLIAASVSMARVALSVIRLWSLRQTCTPVDPKQLDPAVASALTATIADLNRADTFAKRKVTLATSDEMRVPAALGLWHPMIVLPTWALTELSPADLSIILRHEFAHLRRWDDWTNLTQKIVRALFFFHPAVWWIESRLSVEREMACDDVVVAQTDNPMGYASCLISLLERSLAQRGWTMAQAIVHRAREASIRVAQILDKNRSASTALSKPALGLVGLFTLLCVVMVPSTPQFVSFNSDQLPADHQYSATLRQSVLARPAMVRASFHPAPALPAEIVPARLRITESPAKSSASRNSQLVHDPSAIAKQVAMPTGAQHYVDRSADRSIAWSADPELVANAESAMDPAIIAASDMQSALATLMQVNAIARENLHPQNLHPMMPTLVFFQATQFTSADPNSDDSDDDDSSSTPAATLWRVQVWRVTLINPTWQRRANVPVASKT